MIPVSIPMIESDRDRAFMTNLYQNQHPLMFAMALRYDENFTPVIGLAQYTETIANPWY